MRKQKCYCQVSFLSVSRHNAGLTNEPELCLPFTDTPISQLLDRVYPRLTNIQAAPLEQQRHYYSQRAVLAPLNADVDALNTAALERLAGSSKVYLSVDTALDEVGNPTYGTYPTEYLNTIALSGMPTHQITLKVGCPIILLRTLDASGGLCNGTRLLVTALKKRVIEAIILSGTHAGKSAFIPRINLVTASSSSLSFNLRRRQFPIRLAFGMSINKAQGQSLETVGIYLQTPVFAHGQLYVAISRSTNCRQIYISLLSFNLTTTNIVYREVLMRVQVEDNEMRE